MEIKLSDTNNEIPLKLNTGYEMNLTLETRYMYIEKKVSLWLLCGVQHTVIMANFIMPETNQPIIVIIYSVYFLKNLVEL